MGLQAKPGPSLIFESTHHDPTFGPAGGTLAARFRETTGRGLQDVRRRPRRAGATRARAGGWRLGRQGQPDARSRQVFTLFNTSTPEVYADIDRTKAEMLGVPSRDFLTLSRQRRPAAPMGLARSAAHPRRKSVGDLNPETVAGCFAANNWLTDAAPWAYRADLHYIAPCPRFSTSSATLRSSR
jgi:hypothetical protein